MATQLTDTDRVLDHHLQTLGAGDLGGVMDDYTEESILVGPEGTMKGREAIRSFFETLISGLFKPGTYELTVAVYDRSLSHAFDHRENLVRFDVLPGEPNDRFGVMTLGGQWSVRSREGSPA